MVSFTGISCPRAILAPAISLESAERVTAVYFRWERQDSRGNKTERKGNSSCSFCLQVVEKEEALNFYKNKLVKIPLSALALRHTCVLCVITLRIMYDNVPQCCTSSLITSEIFIAIPSNAPMTRKCEKSRRMLILKTERGKMRHLITTVIISLLACIFDFKLLITGNLSRLYRMSYILACTFKNCFFMQTMPN